MFLVPILFLALISCNKSKAGENEVKRVDGTLKYKVLNSDLSVNFIGEEEDFFNAYRRLQLFYLGEYIVWFSGGTKDAYFHGQYGQVHHQTEETLGGGFRNLYQCQKQRPYRFRDRQQWKCWERNGVGQRY